LSFSRGVSSILVRGERLGALNGRHQANCVPFIGGAENSLEKIRFSGFSLGLAR
jgi:hypothetical protein